MKSSILETLHSGSEKESGVLGVTQPYLYNEARYSAGVTFHACGLFTRLQVPLLCASEGEMTVWISCPPTDHE